MRTGEACLQNRFIGWLIDRIILEPTRHPMSTAGMSRPVLMIPDVGPLEIWIHRVGPDVRAAPDLIMLKFPGTASRAEDPTDAYGHWWPELNIEIWAVNPPGYGGSAGQASLRHIPSICHLVLEALRSETDGASVVVLGESIGCVSVLYLAARLHVDALLLRDPPPLRETIRSRHRTGILSPVAALLAQQVPEELDTLANAAKSAAPAVIVLSQRDRVVPYALQRRVVEAYRGPSQHLVLTEADHGESPSPSEFNQFKDRTGWLWDQITNRQTNE